MTLRSTLLVTGGALAGGAVGAFLTVLLVSPNSHAPRVSSEKTNEPRVKAPPAAEEAVDALHRRLNSLERRVSLLTFAGAASSPTRPAPADAGASTGAANAQGKETVDNPVFEAAVRDVLDQVEDERDAEREAKRVEWRTERTERFTASLSEHLGLDKEQSAKVKAVLTEHLDALRALRSGEDPNHPMLRTEWRTRTSALAKQAEEKLGATLDAAQKAKYDALDEGDKIGGRGAWGRGAGD